MFGNFLRPRPEETERKARLIVQEQNIDQGLFKLYWYMQHFPAWMANPEKFEKDLNFGLENIRLDKFRVYKDNYGREAVDIDLISGFYCGINFGIAGHNFWNIYDIYDIYLLIDGAVSINIQYNNVFEYYHLPTIISRKTRVRYAQIHVREYHRSRQHNILLNRSAIEIERLDKRTWRRINSMMNSAHQERIKGKYDF